MLAFWGVAGAIGQGVSLGLVTDWVCHLASVYGSCSWCCYRDYFLVSVLLQPSVQCLTSFLGCLTSVCQTLEHVTCRSHMTNCS